MLYAIDILGVIAFSISGVLVALSKRMDPFGILIIAFVTATGGGMLRDVLIGDTPVIWMKNPTYVYLIFGSTVFAIIFRNKIDYLRTSLFLFDTIGIGLYTVIGVEKGISAQLDPVICASLGVMTACFGGVIRDILCGQIPVIFRQEVYATACFLGAICYLVLRHFGVDNSINFIISGVVVIAVRLIAVKFKIALPSVYKD
ncbi:trimeric intracellular cation channel family protein [Formosa sp. A9]|uniref:trimeric intracellular cation channel family protein n=1 Tax=Formosa sp. A9 TaxID=3442641 RepID=UPI003EBAC732